MPYTDPEKAKAAKRKYYEKNKDKVKAAAAETTRKAVSMLRELKESSPCVDCDVSYPACVMQYDHIGSDKIAGVSKVVRHYGWAKVLEEIEKCELVCANCHSLRTWKRQNNLPIKLEDEL